jgi:glycosyltransferase involved in cell wall biosynthesis
MISVVIPTFNAGATLAATLESLVPAAVDGLVREVIVADGGSSDATLAIADGVGADTVEAGPTRPSQLIAAVQRARFPWLLFLNPDCVLGPGFAREAGQLIERVDSGKGQRAAAVFRYELDDTAIAARATETATRFTSHMLGLAYAEQALLIPRTLYTLVGGFRPMPVLEDVDFARRLGRRHLHRMRTEAVNCAARHRSEGYGLRALGYCGCVVLYGLNVPLERIAPLRGRPAAQMADI